MKLDSKKNLAVKTLGVGKSKIVFNTDRLDEIKEAITRQDIKDLVSSGAISIKENKGRKTNVKRKHKKGEGNVKRKVKNRKQEYVKMVRKLRNYVKELVKQGKVDKETSKQLRKQIRNRKFKSKRNLRDNIL